MHVWLRKNLCMHSDAEEVRACGGAHALCMHSDAALCLPEVPVNARCRYQCRLRCVRVTSRHVQAMARLNVVQTPTQSCIAVHVSRCLIWRRARLTCAARSPSCKRWRGSCMRWASPWAISTGRASSSDVQSYQPDSCYTIVQQCDVSSALVMLYYCPAV